MPSKYQKFRKGAEAYRRFFIHIFSDQLKSTLRNTSDVIYYFYFQQRLFHPNELEQIEITHQNSFNNHTLQITVLFQTQLIGSMFYSRFRYLLSQQNKLDFDIHGPRIFDDDVIDKNIHRNTFMLNACVLQRPIHHKLDPKQKRQHSRCISRWNGLCSMKMTHPKFISFFVYNPPYCDPRNKNRPLYELPPPIIERFELSRDNVENYYIEENDDCIVIDFALSDLPTFHQYGFYATGIKSDKQRCHEKYDVDDRKKQFTMESSVASSRSVLNNSNDSWLMGVRDQQRITGGGDDFEEDFKYIEENMYEADNRNYYKKMEKKMNRESMHAKNTDEDIITDVHKSQQICPYTRVRGYCAKHRDGGCPYKYHPQMENNVDLGNDREMWVNPNNHKIDDFASARRQATDIDQEFMSYVVPGDTHNPCLYLQDIIHNCFILRVTIIKCEHYIKRSFYEQKLFERFDDKKNYKYKYNYQHKMFKIQTPVHNLCPTKQQLPYPMLRRVNHNNNIKYIQSFTSPLHYTESKDLHNASYRATMIDFIERLNANHGEKHLESFCLVACLVNYPPIFVIEDFHVSDFKLLEKNIYDGEQNKTWQVLKKLSEGNIDNSKFRTFESSGSGGSGRGAKGDMDYNLSKHCLSCRERYCCRDNGMGNEGRNISFMDIYIDMYYNVQWLNHLKSQELGFQTNRYEWIKSIYVTPLYYHLEVDQEKSSRLFRLKHHLKRSAITFLRVEFQSATRAQKRSDEWEYGNYTRQQVYNFLTFGFSCGGAVYEFFFYSDSQLKDKKCWMYSCQLSKKFNSIKAVRNNLGNFEEIHNPGKLMSRMGLYCTKSTQITTLKASQMEFVDDPIAEDGEKMTDGCSIINKKIVNEKIGANVVSMLARLGGAKCMLFALPSEWIKKVIEIDQKNKRQKILQQIMDEKNKNKNNGLINNKSTLKILNETLQANENRNFNADVIITNSSHKFKFEKHHTEVAIKEETRSSGGFANKEYIAVAYYHFYLQNKQLLFENNIKKYANQWFGILNFARKPYQSRNRIQRVAAEIFLNCDPNKRKNKILLNKIEKTKYRINNARRYTKDGKPNRYFGVDPNYLTNFETEEVTCNSYAKQCWIEAVTKLRIFLPWPSCKMHGIADWTGTLKENEIFLKIKVPITVNVIWCKNCQNVLLDKFEMYCPNCKAKRPTYHVYEGDCGLMKSPCLHPRSYKKFKAVYSKLLDNLCDGECLLFSTQITCKTSPVFAMSGADLDGDHFLVVTQKDLLPLSDNKMENKYGIKVQKFDEQGTVHKIVDDYELVDYFLEHSLYQNTPELAVLHEAYSEHNEEGIGHKDCLTIAKYHSFALDFSKTGVAAIIPEHINIPMNKEIYALGHCIFPHYMCRQSAKQKFHSKMIKGRIFDFVMDQVPSDLINDRKFRKDCRLPEYDQLLSDHPYLRNNNIQNNNNYNNNNYNNNNYNDNIQNNNVQNNNIQNNNIQNNNNYNDNNYNNNEQKQQQQQYSNNNNNNNYRHEDIDDDYHWLDGAMNNNFNDKYSDNDEDEYNNQDLHKNMKWIEETTYEELDEIIKTPQVKKLLKRCEYCTIEEINELRNNLDKYRQNETNQFKQYEALHVDMYYSQMIEEFKNKHQQVGLGDDRSSDNLNENDELKQATV